MRFKLLGDYFDGEFHLPSSDASNIKLVERFCPGNLEEKLWEVATTPSHIAPIVDSASNGYAKWRLLDLSERANYLKKYQHALRTKRDEIAEAIAWEIGKPLWEARTEADAVIAKVDVTINDSLERIAGKKFENILPNTSGQIIYKPIGPSFIIGPFNFPCHLANGQILSALLGGNSIIFKPSGRSFYSGQLLIECFHRAGFPAGVVNLINGRGDAATQLMKEKAIKGIYFTGSNNVGRHIMEVTHKDFSKLVALEMGGKNTSIVHKDANVEQALGELIKACYLTTGQRCTSTSIIAIHNSLQNEFMDKFHQLAKRIIVDHPVEHETEPFMGPLVDENAFKDYLNFMEMAREEKADVIMEGQKLEKKFPGHYVSPSIHYLAKPNPQGKFFMSEIFGPNCTFIPYQDIEEAIAINNMGEYGLAAGVFTADEQTFNLCLRDLEVGVMNWNRSSVGASSRLPFGGFKNSGNYRPAAVATIDSCVHAVSCLSVSADEAGNLDSIKGLSKE